MVGRIQVTVVDEPEPKCAQPFQEVYGEALRNIDISSKNFTYYIFPSKNDLYLFIIAHTASQL